MMFTLLALVSFNQVSAQTPSPSSYILSASIREYITPFAGFGVDMTPDSCSAYANIAADITKITYLLSTQIKEMMELYSSQSCNTEVSPSVACTNYLDTINNLTLTYATYQAEALKQASDKTRVCNADNTRKVGVYKRTYYGIDVVALTYASVRDVYVGKKFTDYATLINNVNTNLVSKLNAAIVSNKFVDTKPVSKPLRILAQNTLKTTTKVAIRRARVIPAVPTASLSNPNAFLFFGQTSNTGDGTLGAIPFNSLQEYVNAYNDNNTRFGDIYSTINRPLLDAGSATLVNINKQIDLRLPSVKRPAPAAEPVAEVVPPVTQKASVINSIGNWFGDVWGIVSDFFGYIFWGETAGARPMAASGTGSETAYPETCPGLKGPRPAPSLSVPLQSDSTSGATLLKPSEDGWLRSSGIFNNLFVQNSDIQEVVYKSISIPSGNIPTLTPEEETWLVRSRYIDDNEYKSSSTPEVSEKKPGDIQKKVREVAVKYVGKYPDFEYKSDLSKPIDPYDCLRKFDFINAGISADDSQIKKSDQRDLMWDYGVPDLLAYAFSYVDVTVTALNQTARATYNTKAERSLDVLTGKREEKKYSDLKLKYYNNSKKITK